MERESIAPKENHASLVGAGRKRKEAVADGEGGDEEASVLSSLSILS